MNTEESQQPPDTFSFIAMPGTFFKNIRCALMDKCSDEELDAALFHAGKETAGEVMNNSQGRFDPEGGIDDILSDLWLENGLGRLQIKKKLGGSYEIVSEESAEALCSMGRGKKSCAFTTGYLEGVFSALMKNEYSCEEKVCIAEDPKIKACKYVLKKK